MKTLIIVILIFATTFVKAQSISPFVLNSTGGFFQENNIWLDISVGEIVTSTISNSETILTQGFLQPDYNLVSIKKHTHSTEINYYPNPVRNELFITTGLNNIKSVNVYDYSGRIVIVTDYSNNIDMSQLTDGLYIVELVGSDNQKIESFKIQKIK